MKCPCFLLEALDTPALITLPAAARLIWLQLARKAHTAGVSVLRFGSTVPSDAEIALLVPVQQTELEPNLNRLLAAGMLTREPDNALAIPFLAERLKRSEINRINGLKGGRPRKHAAPREQGHMPLPLPGGRGSETEKTESEPSHARAPAAAASASTAGAEAAAEAALIGRWILARIGLDAASWRYGFAEVQRWLDAGADRATIEAVVDERVNAGVAIGSVRYFNDAVMEAIVPKHPTKTRFERALAEWDENGREGPPPTLAEAHARFAA